MDGMSHISFKMFNHPLKRGVLFFFALWMLAGCGYHFSGAGGAALAHLHTFSIDVFLNKTNEAYAGNVFRNAFINRFIQAGRFKRATKSEETDFTCRGTINSILTSPLSYNAANLASEERMTATLEIICEERETGRIIWENRDFTGTGDYRFVGAASAEKNRKNALLKLADDMAERAYSLMMSDF
jgi:hypothetical protein